MVVGDVRNEGGQVAVSGMIIGRLTTTAGETSVDPDAVIKSAE